jgi:hypothetical protein
METKKYTSYNMLSLLSPNLMQCKKNSPIIIISCLPFQKYKILIIKRFFYINFEQNPIILQWPTGWWFSPGSSVSSTNKTDRHDITEILLKVVVLNTIKPNQTNTLVSKCKQKTNFIT